MPDAEQTPPKGDLESAEKYISQLVDLIVQNKIEVYRTDLKKFDPTTLQDHYSVNLKNYQIEISHSKHPESSKSSYVMIFNNLANLSSGSREKVILGYVYLPDALFLKFKIAADGQLEAKRRAEEEKRFNEAVEPIDQLLINVSGENSLKNSSSVTTAEEEYTDPPQLHQI